MTRAKLPLARSVCKPLTISVHGWCCVAGGWGRCCGRRSRCAWLGRSYAFRIAQVGAEFLPMRSAIGRRHQILETDKKLARIGRGERNRLVSNLPKGGFAVDTW